MRYVGIASIVFVLALTFVISGFGPAVTAQQFAGQSGNDGDRRHRKGQAIFRFDKGQIAEHFETRRIFKLSNQPRSSK